MTYKKGGSLKSLQRKLLKDPKYREFHFNPPANYQASKLIKDLRINQRMTQAEFGKRVRLPQAVVARMENGAHYPSLRTLESILKRFGLVLVLSTRKRKK